jgi:hypothetical protein
MNGDGSFAREVDEPVDMHTELSSPHAPLVGPFSFRRKTQQHECSFGNLLSPQTGPPDPYNHRSPENLVRSIARCLPRPGLKSLLISSYS